jgi:tRNA U34 5-methylaminomethyl-2-thiouridine-forming methyltransferase MnmC
MSGLSPNVMSDRTLTRALHDKPEMSPSHDITWRDGRVPVSTQFDDTFYSLENGLDETRHVFLSGNGLPERFCDGFHVAELGFGTGLNLVASLLAWQRHGVLGRFRYTSFEAYPLAPEDAHAALLQFPEAAPFADDIARALEGGRAEFPDCDLTIVIGDARDTLPTWHNRADAWFLDGFAPAKNPELWESSLLNAVGRHTNRYGTFATYSAAGAVRRALSDAGFHVDRVPGYGRKRHMTVGRKT